MVNKRLIILLFLVIGVNLLSDELNIYAKSFTVVLDAGHGGEDSGAVGKRIKEKDINLAIVLRLGALIEQNHKDVNVVYTRKTDVFIPLIERSRIANSSHADLFISVHTNAAANKSAYGTETYALGLAKTEESLAVAKRENAVILLEDDYKTTYEDFDPNSTESYIMFDIMQGTNLEHSIEIASYIQNQFTTNSKRSDRGVRQAGFWVLRATSMPSVLIEVGFVSNYNEETFMQSDAGRQSLAESIYNAFTKYKTTLDRKQGGELTQNPTQIVSDANSSTTSERSSQQGKDGSECYKIQFLLSSREIPKGSTQFKGLTNKVTYYRENGYYKYVTGEYTTTNSAEVALREVKKKFKDAFIVRFVDGVKVAR